MSRHFLFKQCVGLFFSSCFFLQVYAQFTDSSFKIKATSYHFDQKTQTYTYYDALISWGDMSFEADEVRYDQQTKFLEASGNIRLFSPKFIAVMDRIIADLASNDFSLENATLYDWETQTYFRAKRIHQTSPTRFVAEDCIFTTCPPESSAWEIEGATLEYNDQDVSKIWHAQLRIANIPVFYSPYFAWPTVSRRRSGFLIPHYQSLSTSGGGERFDLGSQISVPYFFVLGKEHDVTFTANWIEKRGIGQELDYQYAFRQGLRGNFKTWFIDEAYDRHPEEVQGKDAKPRRFKSEWNHNQLLMPQTRLIISALAYSDSQVQREYDRMINPDPNYKRLFRASLSQQLERGDWLLRFSRESIYQNIDLYDQSTDLSHPQRLPEIQFFWSDTFFDKSLSLELDSSAIRFERESGLNGSREIITPQIGYRFSNLFQTVFKYGQRLSQYQVYNNTSQSILFQNETTALKPFANKTFGYQINLLNWEVNTQIFKIWQSDGKVFSKFKHILQPRLLYEFIDDVAQNESQKIKIFESSRTKDDQKTKDYFDVEDQQAGKKLVSLRFDNLLLAKEKSFTTRVELTRYSLQQLRINGLPEETLRKLSSLTDRHFLSEFEFLQHLDILLQNTITQEDKSKILLALERSMVQFNRNRPSLNTDSWIVGKFNIIQRYNLLREDKDFQLIGPTIEKQETQAGQPLLPLILEGTWKLQENFSVDFMARYHYQLSRIVESKSTFRMKFNQIDHATVNYHKNDMDYRTPDNEFHAKTNTLNFENSFALTNEIIVGVAGKFNLDASTKTTLNRRLVEDSLSLTWIPDCYTINVKLQETVIQEQSQTEAFLDQSITLNITLGKAVSLPSQAVNL